MQRQLEATTLSVATAIKAIVYIALFGASIGQIPAQSRNGGMTINGNCNASAAGSNIHVTINCGNGISKEEAQRLADAYVDITKGVEKGNVTSSLVLSKLDKLSNELNSSNRPWLSIDETKIEYVNVNNFMIASYGINATIENAGHIPATNTFVLSDLIFPYEKGGISPQGEIRKTCHKEDKSGPRSGIAIPPDQQPRYPIKLWFWTPKMPFAEAFKTSYVHPENQDHLLNAYLVVCILYRSPASDVVHHTGVFYNLSLKFSSDEVNRILDHSVETLNPISLLPDRLVLHKFDLMNDVID